MSDVCSNDVRSNSLRDDPMLEWSAEIANNRHGSYALTNKDYTCVWQPFYVLAHKIIDGASVHAKQCTILKLLTSFVSSLSVSLAHSLLYLDTNFPILISSAFLSVSHSFNRM